jgi:hypothetical protein
LLPFPSEDVNWYFFPKRCDIPYSRPWQSIKPQKNKALLHTQVEPFSFLNLGEFHERRAVVLKNISTNRPSLNSYRMVAGVKRDKN